MDNQKNPDEMSMDELRAFVEQNLEPEAQEKPRDEQGRYAKTEEAPVAKPEPAEEVVYQTVIDLGDGSGVEVFEGKTPEEVNEKLKVAKENATRKIRAQEQELRELRQLKAKIVEPPAPAPLSEADRWVLSQRLINEPEKVIEEYVDRTIQAKVAPKLKKLDEMDRQAAIEQTAEEWVAAHPDYYASPKNGKKIESFLRTYGLDPSPENFSKAFEDLNESGLLEARPAETPAEPEAEPQPVRRIVDPAPVATTVRRKVVGGLSTKRSAPVEQAAPGLTEDELYKMPMDDLKQLMYRFQQS